MWYERRAGWGSIKSHWCIVLFFSLSLSASWERVADGWRREIKKVARGEKNARQGWSILHFFFFRSFFFATSLLLSLAFLDLQSQRSDRCVCQRVFHNAACGMRYEKKSVFTHSCGYLRGCYADLMDPSDRICFPAATKVFFLRRTCTTLCLLYLQQCTDNELWLK